MRYSKSLLGVRKEIEIEEWVKAHIDEIGKCNNEEELLEEIFPLLLQTNNSLIKACNNTAELIELGKMWINGYCYEAIHNCAVEEKHICIYKRGRNNLITINQVIDLCDSFFSYDCTLLIAAIENIEYFCDDDSLNDIIRLLSKRMRYGLSNQCAITLYEMGFNDRVIASCMADIIEQGQHFLHLNRQLKSLFHEESSFDRVMSNQTIYHCPHGNLNQVHQISNSRHYS